MLGSAGLTLLGLILLVAGGEAAVRGGVSLAARLRVRPYLIGATVIAFGTSLPEFAVTMTAGIRSSGDLAIGNVVGSNIANLGLILGVSALLRPVVLGRGTLRSDVPISLAGLGLLMLFTWRGAVGHLAGVILLAVGVATVTWTIIRYGHRSPVKATDAARDPDLPAPLSLSKSLVLILAGLAALAGGGHVLVTGAVALARGFGVSEWIIAVTVVAVGTSLPELAASTVAALKGEGDLSIGNVLGSNSFNVFFVLGGGATARTMHVTGNIRPDLLCLAALTLAVLGLLVARHRLSRFAGAVLLAAYVVYLALPGLQG